MNARRATAVASLLALSLALPGQGSIPPVPLGPLGGSAISIALDPQNPDVMLVIRYTEGLFRSTDGGLSFAPFGVGISSGIRELTEDPRNPNTLFVLEDTRVLRSTDFGATWTPLALVAGRSLDGIAVPASGNGLLVFDAFNVYHTSDNGATWSTAATTVPYGGEVFGSITYAPSDPNIAYFGSTRGVYRSVDGGASFSRPGTFSSWAQAVTVSPSDPNVVFAGTISDVYRSTDGAATFAIAGAGLPARTNTEFFAWEPDGSLLWFATLGNGMYFSGDLGGQWLPANAGFSSLPGLPGALAHIPADMAFDGQGRHYLGTESNSLSGFVGGGIYRNQGVGAWQHIAYGEIAIHDVAVAGPGGTRVAATGSGPYAAAPGSTLSPTGWSLQTFDVAIDPLDADRWLTGGVGAFFDNAQIVVMSRGGSEVRIAYERFGAGQVEDIAFDPTAPDRVVAGMFPAGFGTEAIVFSTDRGVNWTEAAGTAGWATRAVAFDPHTPARVLQLSDNNQWAESLDGGQTWGPLQPAWPGTGRAVLLAFDPFMPGVIYRGDAGSGLWRSDDNGQTWNLTAVGLHEGSDLELHPEFPGLLFVADNAGTVQVSGDRGTTAIALANVPSNASGLAVDTSNGSLLLGTTAASALELPGASPLVKLGDGTPGTGGFVARHYASGLSQLGNPAFRLEADQLAGGAPAFLVLGTVPFSFPLWGGTLFVGDPLVLSIGMASGTPGAAGAGSVTVPIRIPNIPALAGQALVSQFIALDPGAQLDPLGRVLSDGMRWTILP